MSDNTTRLPAATTPEFQTARLLPGTNTGAGISGAAVFLIREDDRTIPSREMSLVAEPRGHLDKATARFFWWLSDTLYVNNVVVECRAGLMVAALCFVDGETNPALALLNRLRERAGETLLTGTEVATLAGLDPHAQPAPHAWERTPSGALVASKLEELLCVAANTALARLPRLGAAH